MITSLALISLLIQDPQDSAERMLRLATADQPIVTSTVIHATPREVWKAWTTDAGITGWMVASGKVDLRIGGSLTTSYTKGSTLDGPDVIVNTILAFDPERMLTIKTSRTPENFPFKEAMKKCWTVIYFESMEDEKTRVTVRMNGYTHDAESQKMKDFFRHGNQVTLDALAKYFAK